MVNVIISEDCGNSPKNAFIANLSIAFAKGDAQFILSSVTDDIQWKIVGGNLFQGKEELAKALAEMKNGRVEEIIIHHSFTHGKAGAVNGMTKLRDGTTCEFCDVYEFSGVKGDRVKTVTSYVIEIS